MADDLRQKKGSKRVRTEVSSKTPTNSNFLRKLQHFREKQRLMQLRSGRIKQLSSKINLGRTIEGAAMAQSHEQNEREIEQENANLGTVNREHRDIPESQLKINEIIRVLASKMDVKELEDLHHEMDQLSYCQLEKLGDDKLKEQKMKQYKYISLVLVQKSTEEAIAERSRLARDREEADREKSLLDRQSLRDEIEKMRREYGGNQMDKLVQILEPMAKRVSNIEDGGLDINTKEVLTEIKRGQLEDIRDERQRSKVDRVLVSWLKKKEYGGYLEDMMNTKKKINNKREKTKGRAARNEKIDYSSYSDTVMTLFAVEAMMEKELISMGEEAYERWDRDKTMTGCTEKDLVDMLYIMGEYLGYIRNEMMGTIESLAMIDFIGICDAEEKKRMIFRERVNGKGSLSSLIKKSKLKWDDVDEILKKKTELEKLGGGKDDDDAIKDKKEEKESSYGGGRSDGGLNRKRWKKVCKYGDRCRAYWDPNKDCDFWHYGGKIPSKRVKLQLLKSKSNAIGGGNNNTNNNNNYQSYTVPPPPNYSGGYQSAPNQHQRAPPPPPQHRRH